MSDWDQQRRIVASRRRPDRPYVLVADTLVTRIDACVDSAEPFDVAVRVAADGERAIDFFKRVGPPALLIADLSLPRIDGFAVIEALRALDRDSAQVIAWAASRDIREFAAHRLAGLNVRVLNGAAPAGVLRSAIRRALRTVAGAASNSSSDVIVEDNDQAIRALSDRARQLSGAPGAAVYLKAPLETKYRSAITWTSEAPIPHSLAELPRAFSAVVETGATLVVPDEATRSSSGDAEPARLDAVHGMVAVPIIGADRELRGVICVFDARPLSLPSGVIGELEALGRQFPSPGSIRSASRPPIVEERSSPQPAAVTRMDVVEDAPSPTARPAVLDRRNGDIAIARELLRARRERRNLSVILFVVDPVSSESDRGNEAAVDPVATLSDTLTTAIRGYDLAIRWGRAALLVVLPGLSRADARHVAERVRAVVKAGDAQSVAVSGGVAELLAEDTFDAVVARAFEKAELARERGHNRVA
jgi:GGDEF domain-containing protein/CheY-like chemotaxis protein